MEKKKMAVIGVGGQTGTMFAFELRNSADILGIGREVEIIEEKRLYVEREGKSPGLFKEKVIRDVEFHENLEPDVVFLATKNPVSPPIRYYYQKFKNKEKIPTLLISQNGIAALLDTKEVLKEIFGKDSEKIRLIRMVLFNPIDKRKVEDKIYIKYSRPIRIAMAKVAGEGGIGDVVEVFKMAGFEIKEFPPGQARNLELSKLFLNLIGMAAATRGFSIEEGFKDQGIFREEVETLKEYIKVVKTSAGQFLNFPHYPVKFLSILFGWLPIKFLLPFKNIIARIVSQTRGRKPKVLDEIDYYNGAVVNLGKKTGVKTPVNERIYNRGLERLNKSL